jgi:cytochrome b
MFNSLNFGKIILRLNVNPHQIGANMRNLLIYDLPTRIFHWLFAGLFIAAFFIAKTIDDESTVFAYHMLAGLTLGFVVTLRVIWAFIGTKNAQFSSFAFAPKDLFGYFTGFISGSKRKWAGHNPASSWAAIIMMTLALGLSISGYLMASGGDKESIEDIHELFANGFVIVAILHVTGIVLHSVRYRDGIGLSMLDGKKEGVDTNASIANPKTAFGIAYLVLVIIFGILLVQNYDTQNQTLNIFGQSLQLGESENENSEQGEEKNDSEEDDKSENENE